MVYSAEVFNFSEIISKCRDSTQISFKTMGSFQGGSTMKSDKLNRIFAELSQEIRQINAKNGWDLVEPEDWEESHKIPACLMLITSELAEALEAFRAKDFANFKEEMADTVVRILDLIGAWGDFDLGTQILEKMAINRERGYKHGGKRV